MEVKCHTEQGIELEQKMCRIMNLYDISPVVLCRTVLIGNSERTVPSLTATEFPCNNFQINSSILRQQICSFFYKNRGRHIELFYRLFASNMTAWQDNTS